MKRLIWKELREKRLWLLPLALYPVGCVLARQGYSFVGLSGPSQFQTLPISGLIALLMGLTAYAPELGSGTADFLYAKPVGWKRVLGAKLAVALALFVASAILVALVFRIICPGPYLPFMTLGPLVKGAGIAVLVMLYGYAIGLCCSVVLPGMLGSILTLAGLSGILAAAIMLNGTIRGSGSTVVDGVTVDTYSIYEVAAKLICAAAAIGVVAAALLTIRFGLTLSIGARARRYAAIFGVILVTGSIAIYAWARTAPPRVYRPPLNAWRFSRSGKYALNTGHYPTEGNRPHVLHIYRLSDGAKAVFSAPGGYFSNDGWTSDDKIVALYHWPRGKLGPIVLRLLWLDQDGKLRVREMRFPDATSASLSVSPSGKLGLVHLTNWTPDKGYSRHAEHTRRVIVDLAEFRKLDVKLPSGTDSFAWVADSVLSYRLADSKTKGYFQVRP